MFIVATNVIASRPPERRATGTPHARANKAKIENVCPIRLLRTVKNLY